MSKRRWWEADERFRGVERRLRANFVNARAAADAAAEKRIRVLRDEHAAQIQRIREGCGREVMNERAKAEELISEITRVRLEYGPRNFGTRFTLWVSMEENFVRYSRNLKDMAGYIIEVLCAKIQREFAQIDFERVKPLPPTWDQRRDPPTFRIDIPEPRA